MCNYNQCCILYVLHQGFCGEHADNDEKKNRHGNWAEHQFKGPERCYALQLEIEVVVRFDGGGDSLISMLLMWRLCVGCVASSPLKKVSWDSRTSLPGQMSVGGT